MDQLLKWTWMLPAVMRYGVNELGVYGWPLSIALLKVKESGEIAFTPSPLSLTVQVNVSCARA